MIDPPIIGPKPPVAPEPQPERIRGLGDVIAAVTKTVGIRPCGGCQQRREALNRAIPFGKAPVAGTPVGDLPGKASDPAPGLPGS